MKVTEQSSNYANLDKMSTEELLKNMNNEDKNVPVAVEKCIPQIEKLVDGIVERMKKGGRLFYLGAGTSGRLGILDASEIPPTYGAPFDLIIGLIAGVIIATAVMCLMNYLVTPYYMGAPREAVVAMLIPVIIPFNLLKAGLNAVITFLVYKRISGFLHKEA